MLGTAIRDADCRVLRSLLTNILHLYRQMADRGQALGRMWSGCRGRAGGGEPLAGDATTSAGWPPAGLRSGRQREHGTTPGGSRSSQSKN